MRRLILAFRWIVVLPGAVVAMIIAKGLLPWIMQNTLPFPDLFVQFWCCVTIPAISICVGVYIAPRFKFMVALALAVLFSAVFLFAGGLAIANELPIGSTNKWWYAGLCGVAVGSTLVTCVAFHSRELGQNDEIQE